MNKYLKGGLIFSGGFLTCGVLTTTISLTLLKKALNSEVISSNLKNTISDGVTVLLYGELPRKRSYERRQVVNYGERYNMNNVIVETREDAEMALDRLNEIVRAYGCASVSDLYELLGIKSISFSDTKYGWNNLSKAKIVHLKKGYTLDLPHPHKLS